MKRRAMRLRIPISFSPYAEEGASPFVVRTTCLSALIQHAQTKFRPQNDPFENDLDIILLSAPRS